MTLSIAIMAHPDRMENVIDLMATLDAGAAFDGGSGENATGDSAWALAAATAGRADWCVVLQDDAIPITGFTGIADDILASAPDSVVSFYTGTGQPRAAQVGGAAAEAELTRASWLEADTLLWGVAVAIPTHLVAEMLASVARSGQRYDTRIGRWAQLAGLPIRYSWPSIVDHADGPSIAQSSPKRGRARRGKALPPRHAHKIGVPTLDGPVVQIAGRWS